MILRTAGFSFALIHEPKSNNHFLLHALSDAQHGCSVPQHSLQLCFVTITTMLYRQNKTFVPEKSIGLGFDGTVCSGIELQLTIFITMKIIKMGNPEGLSLQRHCKQYQGSNGELSARAFGALFKKCGENGIKENTYDEFIDSSSTCY